MDQSDVNNISALFKRPAILPTRNSNLNKPAVPIKTMGFSLDSGLAPAKTIPTTKPAADPVNKKDFSLVDFSKNKVITQGINDKAFRFNTQRALKGTLKHSVDRKDVADLLWYKRGYGGLNKGEVRKGLNDLATKRGWSNDKTRAVKRKMGI